MAGEWNPADYHDEFRERLQEVIRKRIKAEGAVAKVEDEPETREDAATNVVDFMALLQKSLDSKKRTPAGKDVTDQVVEKAAAKAAKKAAKAAKSPAKTSKTTGKATKAAKAPPKRKAG